MSVMSAAETGSSPDVPRRRLRLAAAAAGQDDGDRGAIPPGAGADAGPGPAAPEPDGDWPGLAAAGLRATELRVREVRVVREASVRTLQGSGPVAAQARTATRARAVQAQAVTQAQMVNQAANQAWASAAAGTRSAGQTRVVTHRRAATQTRVTTRTRTARPGAVRLTRRGRLVVTGLVLLVAIATATLLWMSAAGSVQAASRGGAAPRSPYQGMTQVVAQPGQTLWSIAAAAEPSANAWAVVQQIVEVNALNGPQVHAGELLWVPRG
jgi:cell wall-associated NlpC family hydrolase